VVFDVAIVSLGIGGLVLFRLLLFLGLLLVALRVVRGVSRVEII